MGNYSPECQALASLATKTERPDTIMRAARIKRLIEHPGDEPRKIFLKGTVALNTPIGSVTAGIYSTEGPAVRADGNRTLHSLIHFAVLRRDASEEESRDVQPVLESRKLSSEVARVFEIIEPVAQGLVGTLAPTQETRDFVPLR